MRCCCYCDVVRRSTRGCVLQKAAFEVVNWRQRCSYSSQLIRCMMYLEETCRELKFSRSACEYDAPTIFLLCVEAFEVLDVVRQKGELELRALCKQTIYMTRRELW